MQSDILQLNSTAIAKPQNAAVDILNVTSEQRNTEVILLCATVVCRAAHTHLTKHTKCKTKSFHSGNVEHYHPLGRGAVSTSKHSPTFRRGEDLQLQEDFSTLKIGGTGLLREYGNCQPIWVSQPRSLSFLQRHGFQ